MRISLLTAVCIALMALPGTAMAQEQMSPNTPSAKNLKGPPNANGYGDSSATGSTSDSKQEMPPSASNMKGPPNANGFQKQ